MPSPRYSSPRKEKEKSEKCNQGGIPENMSEQTRPGKRRGAENYSREILNLKLGENNSCSSFSLRRSRRRRRRRRAEKSEREM